MIDYILTGKFKQKSCLFSNTKTDELKHLITQNLGPEGTYIKR